MNIDLLLQAFTKLVNEASLAMPAFVLLFENGLTIGLAILITWLLTRNFYRKFIEERINETAGAVVDKYKIALAENIRVQAKLKNSEQRNREMMAVLGHAIGGLRK